MNVFTQLVLLLRTKELHIAAAESCTAGLFSASLAGVPGASEVMEYGFIVYSETAKCSLLGVLPETVAAYGVVSEETAREMAAGAAMRAGAQIGVGITGVAGPGAQGRIPEGRVCFAFSLNGCVTTQTVEFGPLGRNRVREESAAFAAKRLLELLEDSTCF